MTLSFENFIWWVSLIELPALSGLLWLILRLKDTTAETIKILERDINTFKLDVAKNYAQNTDLRQLEGRLTSHLLRIEAKLDVTALKTESLQAEK